MLVLFLVFWETSILFSIAIFSSFYYIVEFSLASLFLIKRILMPSHIYMHVHLFTLFYNISKLVLKSLLILLITRNLLTFLQLFVFRMYTINKDVESEYCVYNTLNNHFFCMLCSIYIYGHLFLFCLKVYGLYIFI